jgi:hypothetical protein
MRRACRHAAPRWQMCDITLFQFNKLTFMKVKRLFLVAHNFHVSLLGVKVVYELY